MLERVILRGVNVVREGLTEPPHEHHAWRGRQVMGSKAEAISSWVLR